MRNSLKLLSVIIIMLAAALINERPSVSGLLVDSAAA